MRRPLSFAGLLLALLIALPLAAQQRSSFDYGLVAQEIAPGAYVIVGLREDFSFDNGGNIVNTGFIVGRSGVIVIDTGPSRRYGEQMLAAIRAVTPLPVVLTLNTHHHPDHFLGNQAFPQDTLAALPETIAAHRSEGDPHNHNLYPLNRDWMRDTEVHIPTRALSAGRQDIGGRDVEFPPRGAPRAPPRGGPPPHSGTVYAADLLFNGRAPTTPHADIPRWIAALEQLARLPARLWVPGHGDVSASVTPLHETRDYLEWLAGTMRDAAEAGMDMTEVFARDIPARFAQLALVDPEFRRSVVHRVPAAEQAALSGGRRD